MQSLKSFVAENDVTGISPIKLSVKNHLFVTMLIDGKIENVWLSKNASKLVSVNDSPKSLRDFTIGVVKNAAGEERLRIGSSTSLVGTYEIWD